MHATVSSNLQAPPLRTRSVPVSDEAILCGSDPSYGNRTSVRFVVGMHDIDDKRGRVSELQYDSTSQRADGLL